MLRKKNTSVHMFVQISKEVLRFLQAPAAKAASMHDQFAQYSRIKRLFLQELLPTSNLYRLGFDTLWGITGRGESQHC